MPADPLQAHISREFVAEAPLTCCAFDGRGRYLFAGSENRTITRWDLASEAKSVFSGHDSWVMALAASPDGSTVVSAGGDDHLLWWSVEGDATEPRIRVKAHAGWIRCIAFSPDGKFVASGGNDRMVRLWNSVDGSLVREMKGHELDVYACAFHPTEPALLTGDLMGKIHHWDSNTGESKRVLDAEPLHKYEGGQAVHYGGIRGLTVSPDGQEIAAGGLYKATNPLGNVQEPRVLCFSWDKGELTHQHGADGMANHTIWGLMHHPEKFLIGCIGGGSGNLLFWKEAEEKAMHKFDFPNTARGLALHPEGLLAATAHHDRKARLTKLAPKEG